MPLSEFVILLYFFMKPYLDVIIPPPARAILYEQLRTFASDRPLLFVRHGTSLNRAPPPPTSPSLYSPKPRRNSTGLDTGHSQPNRESR